MTPETAMRQADPARRLPPSRPDEQLLREILSDAPLDPAPARSASRSPQRDRRPLLATAIVAIAVVGVAVVAIRLPGAANDRPATTATSSRRSLEDAVFAKLNEAATGDLPVREKSATTWSDTFSGSDGGAIDLAGRSLYIAAACDGGGAIAIRLTGKRDRTLDCTTPSALGPIDVSAEISSANEGAGLDVVAVTGHPRFIAKAMAFPTPTATTTP